MTVVPADTQAHTAELCDSAFGAFCEDMSSMFGIDFSWDRQGVRTGPVRDLWKPAKKLGVTHQIQATGAVNGTFHLCFDQAGLFVLCGVIVMLPEARILQEVKSGSTEDAKNLQDAAREVGNLLVGSWDRVFRENCSGHKHFVKKSTFLGKPWEDPEKAGPVPDEEVLLASYELTVGSYPSFSCAAIFPKALGIGFEAASDAAASQGQADDEPADEPTRAAQPAQPAPAAKPDARAKPASPDDAKAGSPAPPKRQDSPIRETVPSKDEARTEAVPDDGVVVPPIAVAKTDVTTVQPETIESIPNPTEEADEARWQTVVQESLKGFESIHAGQGGGDPGRMFDGPTVLSLLHSPVAAIMTQDVAWADPDDTVQQCIAKMQQQDCRYVLVGRKGALEGIVSISNIQAALSPYLRPLFAKWRRPEDDATLTIKVKWIMSRPVRTVTPQTTIEGVIESMFHHGSRCLPVVNSEGVVQGIVTVFDILARVIEADPASSWKGKPRQSPPLLL
jgi:CBS domain-containing protein